MLNRRWTIAAGAVLLPILLAILLRAGRRPIDLAVESALAIGAAALMRRWFKQLTNRLTDLTEERRELEAAKAQCIAANGVNNARRDRLARREAEVEREVIAHKAEAEARIRREYEAVRAQELCEAYFEGAMNERAGRHSAGIPEQEMARLISLCERRRAVPAQDTTRGHGDVTLPMSPASSER
jgi:hypothetical protein